MRLDSRVFTICSVLILQPVLFGCGGGGFDLGPPPLSDGTIVYRESIDDGLENIFVSPTPTANEQRINIGAIFVPASYELGPGLNLRSPSQFGLIATARWSPDGTKIALRIVRAADTAQLIVLDRDGSNAKLASPQLLITFVPTWSPDGTELFYTMAKGPMGANIGLFVSNLLTDTVTEIVLPFQTPANGFRGLQWSSDMQHLYFTTFDGATDESVVYQFDRSSSLVTTLVPVVMGRIQSLSVGGKFALQEKVNSATGINQLVRIDLLTFEEILIEQSTDRYLGHFLGDENAILVKRRRPFIAATQSIAKIAGNAVSLTLLLDTGDDFLDFTEQ